MKLAISANYALAPEALARLFGNPDFHGRKLKEVGVKRYEILELDEKGDEVRIKISRHTPLDAPRAIKKVIPAEVNSVSEEHWNHKTLKGKVSTETGIPVEMHCTATISAQGDGSVVNYDWTIKAKVPLIGGALEKFIAGDLKKRMDEEAKAVASIAAEFT